MTSAKPANLFTRLLLICVACFWTLASRASSAPPVEFTLPNGLRLLVRERHTSPLVALELWVRAGAREESQDQIGAAHFLEHTLFKGTRTRGVGGVDLAIESLGATLNAATAPDYARYYTTVGSDSTAAALQILADVVRNATLPNPEVERERQVMRDELALRDSDAGSLLVDKLYAAAFPAHPYGRPPGGTIPEIRARTRDSLAEFYRRTYTPKRCTLVFVGDVKPEQAREMAEQAFGDWTAADGAKVPLPTGPELESSGRSSNDGGDGPPPAPASVRHIRQPADVARPLIGIACRAPAASDGRMVCAAQIVAAMLGQSDIGGRLAAPGLAGTETHVSYAPRRDDSLFIISSTLPLPELARIHDPAKLAAAASVEEQVVTAVLDSFRTIPPTAAELQAAKRALLGRLVFEHETAAGLAAALGAAAVTGGDTPDAWRDRIDRTTLTDVRDFVSHWLDSEHRMVLVLLPRDAGGLPETRQ